jgi:hypothetical protein
MSSNDTIKKQVNHCTIAVSDWLAGGCDVNDIPRPEMAVLVAFQKEWLKDMEQAAQTPQAAKDNLTAFKQYLQECEDCLEVPDVAGAFNAGWRAMQKAAVPPVPLKQLLALLQTASLELDKVIKVFGMAAPAAQPAPCTWTQSPHHSTPDTYHATCGAVWTFTDGGPTDNDMHFCPKCGNKVVEGGAA